MIDTQIDTRARHTCVHIPSCPTADAVDRDAAHVISAHPEQGWSLLCNGVVVFEDFGELPPTAPSIAAPPSALCRMPSPHRPSACPDPPTPRSAVPLPAGADYQPHQGGAGHCEHQR